MMLVEYHSYVLEITFHGQKTSVIASYIPLRTTDTEEEVANYAEGVFRDYVAKQPFRLLRDVSNYSYRLLVPTGITGPF